MPTFTVRTREVIEKVYAIEAADEEEAVEVCSEIYSSDEDGADVEFTTLDLWVVDGPEEE